VKVGSLVLYAGVVARTAAFYKALGVWLEPRPDGREVGEIDGIRVAVVEGRQDEASPGPAVPGTSMIGLRVSSVDEAILAAHQAGGAVLRPTEALDWGRRAVLTDPDGRPVEVVDDIRT
jgi:predicted enzyme related to lactoylglutathione lyase